MIEVFKTNVENRKQSKKLIQQLLPHFPGGKINFDLDDCDRILRVEAARISHQLVMDLFQKNGLYAEILE